MYLLLNLFFLEIGILKMLKSPSFHFRITILVFVKDKWKKKKIIKLEANIIGFDDKFAWQQNKNKKPWELTNMKKISIFEMFNFFVNFHTKTWTEGIFLTNKKIILKFSNNDFVFVI